VVSVPVTDGVWHRTLLEGGLLPRPRPATSWHWCDRCRALVPCHVRWWPNKSERFASGVVGKRRAARSVAGATVKGER
jgi:hypothetical protein